MLELVPTVEEVVEVFAHDVVDVGKLVVDMAQPAPRVEKLLPLLLNPNLKLYKLIGVGGLCNFCLGVKGGRRGSTSVRTWRHSSLSPETYLPPRAPVCLHLHRPLARNLRQELVGELDRVALLAQHHKADAVRAHVVKNKPARADRASRVRTGRVDLFQELLALTLERLVLWPRVHRRREEETIDLPRYKS